MKTNVSPDLSVNTYANLLKLCSLTSIIKLYWHTDEAMVKRTSQNIP